MALLIAYTSAVMTVGKTILYSEYIRVFQKIPIADLFASWQLLMCSTDLNEAFSGFDNVGHNPLLRLVFLWIIPT